MNLSKLRTMDTEQTVRLIGIVMGILSLISLVLLSGWQHRRMTAYQCHPDIYQYSYDNSGCTDITSLTHLEGWMNWGAAVIIAGAIIATVILVVMGLAYMCFGERMGVSNYSRKVNHPLREDYLATMAVLVAFVALVGIVYFIGSIVKGGI